MTSTGSGPSGAALFSTASLMAGEKGLSFVLRFARNVLLARLLGVEDFGIASTFAVAASLVQMVTDLDFGKFMVQTRHGDDANVIAAIKTMQILRSGLVAAILFFTAWPMAALFRHPDLVWAYQLMAVPPLISGLLHPDLMRFTRAMRFGPALLANLVTETVALALLWPLVLVFGDFRALLAILIIEPLVRLAMSFALAERPWQVGWDRAVCLAALRFGWPLMVSGLLLFGILQGDRLIVANQFGAAALGLFSAAFNLTAPAVLTSAALVRSFFLPFLARFRDDPAGFDHRAIFAIQASLCATQLAILGFAIFGPPVVVLVYGEAFAGAAPMVALIGVAMAIQLARAGTATVAIARGHTVNMLISNLVRIAFLPPAFLAAMWGAPLAQVLLFGAVGQILGYAVSLMLLYKRTGLRRPRAVLGPVCLAAAGTGCVLAATLVPPVGLAQAPVLMVIACGAFVLQIATCRVMLVETTRLLRNVLRRFQAS